MPATKPTSKKQRAANRANAKKSTGPRTAEGKQTVSLNAVKHGLTGHVAVLADEDREAHNTFCGDLIREMDPADSTELNLAQAIAHDLWRLNRAHAIENNMFAAGIDDFESAESAPDPKQRALAQARTFRDHAGKFATLTIYEQRINRTVHKNRTELRQRQTERMQARQLALEKMTQQPTGNAIPINDLQLKTAPNGFAYANSISGHA